MASDRLPLSPYPHEINSQGTSCAADCPACHWINREGQPAELLELLLRRISEVQ